MRSHIQHGAERVRDDVAHRCFVVGQVGRRISNSTIPVIPGDSYELHVFFFFQAEDGIRDLTVTGVQTCALPISTGDPTYAGSQRGKYDAFLGLNPINRVWLYTSCESYGCEESGTCESTPVNPTIRSEERRVGKECRSRWSPYH